MGGGRGEAGKETPAANPRHFARTPFFHEREAMERFDWPVIHNPFLACYVLVCGVIITFEKLNMLIFTKIYDLKEVSPIPLY